MIFILLFVAVLLIGLAQKVHIPYPITLVIGGTLMGFIPNLPTLELDPNLILVIVLPPILYYAAFGIAFREFIRNWRDILSLALGLVIFTTLIVALVFKWIFPEYPWAMAFTFGAIVSPPDCVAATSIFKRFTISPKLIAKLEGESLINDASALILYKMGVVALLSGSFTFLSSGLDFIYTVTGGVIVGLILGIALQQFSKRYLEPVLGVVFSFTIPYITFIVASFLNVSGVLAVVINGLIGSRVLPTHRSSLRRVLGYAVWDIFAILMNAFVFILIGLELRKIVETMTLNKIAFLSAVALLISITMVIVRMAWILARVMMDHFKEIHQGRSSHLNHEPFKEALLLGWSGMRGIVSLAAASALPYTLPDGTSLPGRGEVIFITFVVIFITLVIPGLSLPRVVRWLRIQYLPKKEDEHGIRDQLVKVAEEKLKSLFQTDIINDFEFNSLKNYFISQIYVLERSHTEDSKLPGFELARLEVIQTQRKLLLRMWETGEINDQFLQHFENELDIIEVHIARGELK